VNRICGRYMGAPQVELPRSGPDASTVVLVVLAAALVWIALLLLTSGSATASSVRRGSGGFALTGREPD
jgi:hypothetical protein